MAVPAKQSLQVAPQQSPRSHDALVCSRNPKRMPETVGRNSKRTAPCLRCLRPLREREVVAMTEEVDLTKDAA